MLQHLSRTFIFTQFKFRGPLKSGIHSMCAQQYVLHMLICVNSPQGELELVNVFKKFYSASNIMS